MNAHTTYRTRNERGGRLHGRGCNMLERVKLAMRISICGRDTFIEATCTRQEENQPSEPWKREEQEQMNDCACARARLEKRTPLRRVERMSMK
ncbi:hypothetical protein BD413DRAFT_255485 [Trametes elegans]|nr:hypothetical protein BD413DRAFT_255485 [Trametes elegans]